MKTKKPLCALLAAMACTMSLWGGADGTGSGYAFHLHERWGHVSV